MKHLAFLCKTCREMIGLRNVDPVKATEAAQNDAFEAYVATAAGDGTRDRLLAFLAAHQDHHLDRGTIDDAVRPMKFEPMQIPTPGKEEP